jgi:hypothetical protein
MFLDDAALKSRLADVQQMFTGSAELQAWWTSIISDSNRAAYNDINTALLARGYTAAQIAAWDQGIDFQVDIGLWRALVKGGATKDWGPESKAYIDELDRRGELALAVITNGGVVVEPVLPATGAGPISFGQMKNDPARV